MSNTITSKQVSCSLGVRHFAFLLTLLALLISGQAVAQTSCDGDGLSWTSTETPPSPDCLSPGTRYRILFVTSGRRNAASANIADYNSFVQNLANLNPALSGITFRALGSTGTVDARDNTDTNPNTDGRGEPIFYYRGNKVADDYADLYDGEWSSEHPRTEDGYTLARDEDPFTFNALLGTVFTGSDSNGTESIFTFVTTRFSLALGSSASTPFREVQFGFPFNLNFALGGSDLATRSRDVLGHFYALSAPLTVPQPPPSVNICSRTPQVRNEILSQLSMLRSNCANVPESALATITDLGLSFHGNNLSSLQSDDFAGLSGLEDLDLSFNSLTTVPAGIFDGLSNLRTLNVSSNELNTLPPGVFDGLSNLRTLNLGAVDNPGNLTTLSAGIFDDLSNLQTLNLEDHRLAALDANVFNSLSNLQILDLGGNRLAALDANIFNRLSNLQTLDLFDNQLAALDANIFNRLSNLQRLELGGNQFTTLPASIAGLSNLQFLELTSNNLAALDANIFNRLSNLQILQLFDNQLVTLPPGIFSGLTALEVLSLDDNDLTRLSANVFNGLSALTELTLYGNNFTAGTGLPAGVFDDVLDTLRTIGGRGDFLTRDLLIDDNVRDAHFICSRTDVMAILEATPGVSDCIRITARQLDDVLSIRSDATLSALEISSGTLSPAFASGATDYTAEVALSVTSVTVRPTSSRAGATISVNGATVASGSLSTSIALTSGSTATITIVVTAEDRISTETYRVTFLPDTPPNVSGVTITSAGPYALGEFIEATVTFDEIVNVSGAPRIALTVGTMTRQASFNSGNGSNRLTFRYTVAPGDNDTDGVSIAPNALTQIGGSAIQDSIGNNAVLTHGPVAAALTHRVDTSVPTVSRVAITSDGPYARSENIEVTVTFSEQVSVSGAPVLTLQLGAGSVRAAFNRGADSNMLVFRYTVQAGDNDTNGVSIASNALIQVGGSAVRDTAGNNAALNHVAVSASLTHRVDTTSPTLSGAMVNGDMLALSYGEALDGTAAPVADDYVVTTDGRTLAVFNVAVTGNTVTLTLASSVADGQRVTLDYTPGVNPLRDTAGNNAAALNNRGVTNNTPAVPIAMLSAPAALTEANLDGAAVMVVLRNTEYVPILGTGNFTVSATVDGTVRVTDVARVNNTLATLTLAHDGTDITADGRLSVTVLAATHTDSGILDAGSVRITADSEDATLSSLMISDGALSPAFNPTTTDYRVNVINSVATMMVTPTANHPGATITVNGSPVISGMPGDMITLTEGAATMISIVVTAEDGSTTETYAVSVTRAASSDAALSGLTVSAGTLTPAFASGTIRYTAASVAGSVTSVTVTPTANHTGATIIVDGNPVSSGSGAVISGLSVNTMTTITIVVTAADGATMQPYTVSVTPDGTAPELESAVVDGNRLTLSYDEPLNRGSTPLAGDYTVNVEGGVVAVSTVSISGADVVLTLTSVVTGGQTVTLDYTPGVNSVEDVVDNDAAMLNDQAVANNTSDGPTLSEARQMHEEITSKVVQAATANVIASVSGRVETVISSRGGSPSGGGVRLNGQSIEGNGQAILLGFLEKAPEYRLAIKNDNWKRMLANSSFVMNAADENGTGGGVSMWGNGHYTNFVGDIDAERNIEALDWVGGSYGFQVGADTRLNANLLMGMAVSWSEGNVRYTQGSGDTEQKGDYTLTLTGVHPYIGWSDSEGRWSLWGSAGYAEGEVEIEPNEGSKQTHDTSLISMAGGFKRNLIKGLNIKGDFSAIKTNIDESDDTTNDRDLTVDSQRARLSLEGRHQQRFRNGGIMMQSIEAGYRLDEGDSDADTDGAEVGGSMDYHNPATGLTLSGKLRGLAGNGDYREWGVSGLIRLESGTQGLSFTLEPGYGDTAGSVGELWQWQAPSLETERQSYGGRMKAYLGYGLGGFVTPYTEMATGDALRRYRMGVKWHMSELLDLDLFGEQHQGADTKNALKLEGELRF